ncbi:hypothetical protein NR756_13200 [Alloalcanivorax xenomutans]|uniref:hypothetical protein n=1 Tax=Alloalcanivorax xenomutans TaxID=1094342 RepID=UPI003A80A753
MKAKIIMLSALGVASFGLTQAANAGWEMDDCSNSPSGPAPCIEWSNGTDTYHFNGDGGHEDDWHGHPSGGDFVFQGNTVLNCPLTPELDCTLTLDGQVKKFEVDGQWHIGIRVNDSEVSGGLLCGAVDVGGFPWYLGPTNEHDVFDENSGISWPASLIGNFGNIDVTALTIPVATNTHIHDVTYDNVNTFSFDGNLYENGTEVDTGCSVVGDLQLLPSGTTLSIQ